MKKVYEIGWEDEEDKVVWIATNRQIKLSDVGPPEIYLKELPFPYSEDTNGIDLIIE